MACHGLERITEICMQIHDQTSSVPGFVHQDRCQMCLVTEYRDFAITPTWDLLKIRDLSDSALHDLICKRQIEALQEAIVLLQTEVKQLETPI